MSIKKTILIIGAALLTLPLTAQSYDIDTDKLSQYDQNKPIGFGEGITGGEGGEVVIVTTNSEFRSHMGISNSQNKTVKKIIYISGTIGLSNVGGSGIRNKTIIGLPGSALVNTQNPKETGSSGILTLSNCSNIIIRNITFKGGGAYDMDGNDNLYLNGSSNIWLDHCEFQDGVDGNLDCSNGSDNICVTWCRFRYLIDPWPDGPGGADDHRFSNLWGGSDKSADTDMGKLNTTFANCWWDEGCKERMPRIRFGKVHLLNCLYSSSVTNYCVGAGYRCNAYIENCAFTSNGAKNKPWAKYATKSGYTDYNIQLVGNQGAADNIQHSGSITQFVPSYTYGKYEASLVESVVSNSESGAGATLHFKDATGILAPAAKTSSLSVEYYNAAGQRVGADAKGLVIMKQRMTDGTIKTIKATRK